MIADLKPYPKYKHSGLPSLGPVPSHWGVQKPKHIGLLLKGVGGTKEDALSAGVPCVRYGELYTTHTYFVRRAKAFIHPDRASSYTPLHYGDVLFAASGETLEEIGKSAVNLIEGAAVCGGDVIILRPTIPVHAPFLGYVMDCRPSRHQKATMGRGTTVKHVYPDELKTLLFPFPPEPEQAAIVRFLDWANGRLERAIRAKRQVIALLNEQRQAIIHRAVTRGLDPSVPLRTSGIPWLGDIPQHWEVRRLSSVARFMSGKAHEQFVDAAGDNICVTARFVSTNGASRKYCTRNFCAAKRHDVLMVMSDLPNGRALARSYLVNDDDYYAVNQRVCILRAHSIDPRLLSYWANRNWHLLRNDDGLNQTHLSNYDFKTMPVLLPPEHEQRQIADSLDAMTSGIDAACRRLIRECELLQEYRTRLVADVVTGKLDVREAAARLPAEAPFDSAEDEADLGDEAEAADEETSVA